jgi:hypothetical protein
MKYLIIPLLILLSSCSIYNSNLDVKSRDIRKREYPYITKSDLSELKEGDKVKLKYRSNESQGVYSYRGRVLRINDDQFTVGKGKLGSIVDARDFAYGDIQKIDYDYSKTGTIVATSISIAIPVAIIIGLADWYAGWGDVGWY